MTSCNGSCAITKAKSQRSGSLKYKNGFRYCSVCRVWFGKLCSFRCPCCNTKLRTRPRSHKCKIRFRSWNTNLKDQKDDVRAMMIES